MNKKIYPNLFIPGFPKCGSYFLYDLLDQHPEISMCKVKEPSFFMKEGSSLEFNEFYNYSSNAIYYGEATVEYIILPDVIEKIKATTPNSKLVVLVRDPVKRSISHYFHRINSGTAKGKFSSILKERGEKNFPVYYSQYKKHLQGLFSIFERDKVLIVISEELYTNPEGTLSEIFSFLELENTDLKFEQAYQNQGVAVRNKYLNFYIRKMAHNKKLKRLLNPLSLPLGKVRKKIEQSNIKKVDYVQNKEISSCKSYLEEVLFEDKKYIRELVQKPDLWK